VDAWKDQKWRGYMGGMGVSSKLPQLSAIAGGINGWKGTRKEDKKEDEPSDSPMPARAAISQSSSDLLGQAGTDAGKYTAAVRV